MNGEHCDEESIVNHEKTFVFIYWCNLMLLGSSWIVRGSPFKGRGGQPHSNNGDGGGGGRLSSSSGSSIGPPLATSATIAAMRVVGRGFNKTKYGGGSKNSTSTSGIPLPNEVAAKLQVQPLTEAPAWVWKYAWRIHGKLLLPILHMFDRAKAKDMSQSLKVVWLKALASRNKRSPVYEPDPWTYDMLPSVTRKFLQWIPCHWFPRLHHANIELRTAYLDQRLVQELSRIRGCEGDASFTPTTTNSNQTTLLASSVSALNHETNAKTTSVPPCCIRLISMGAGYDTRATRLLTQGLVDQAWELDLPTVIASKKTMLIRLQQRRHRRGLQTKLPYCQTVDLNEPLQLQGCLQTIFNTTTTNADQGNSSTRWCTIFLSEGVLIYVNDPMKVLEVCATSSWANNNDASLCFADRLANVPGGNYDAGVEELQKCHWDLIDWCPKPGLARHMGLCHLRESP